MWKIQSSISHLLMTLWPPMWPQGDHTQDIETLLSSFFHPEISFSLSLRVLNISFLWVLNISFLRVLNISWSTGGWIYGQLSMASQQLSSLWGRRDIPPVDRKWLPMQMLRPDYTNPCDRPLYVQIFVQITHIYALCTHTARAYTKYSFHLISNRWQNYHWADIYGTHAIFFHYRLFAGWIKRPSNPNIPYSLTLKNYICVKVSTLVKSNGSPEK